MHESINESAGEEEHVQPSTDNGTDNRGHNRDPSLAPAGGALVRDWQDGVQQTRHEVAGRVQARAGRATHGGHEAPHNEADDDGGGGVILLAPSQGQAAQGAEDEHQGAEHLVEEVVDLLVVRVGGAEGAEDGVGVLGLLVVRVVGQVDDELAEQGAEQLSDDVRQHVAPREQAVDGLGDGHGRVDMSAGYATEHEHREHDAEAIAHGDVQPAGVVALGVLEFDIGHGTVAEDHQDGGAEELGGQLGIEGVFHCFFFSLRRAAGMADCSRHSV
mgnify:FL=1